RPPPHSRLFPYTTLFRSRAVEEARAEDRHQRENGEVHPEQASRNRDEMADAGQQAGHEDSAAAVRLEPRVRFLQAIDGEMGVARSEEHTSELQSLAYLVC